MKLSFQVSQRHRLLGGFGAAIMAALVFVVAQWWLFGPDCTHHPNHVYFTVHEGESADSIAQRLVSARLLHTAWGFLFIAVRRRWAGQLRPGTYHLSPAQTPQGILLQLVHGKTINQIAVPAGIHVSQVIARLRSHHIGTSKQYKALEEHPLPGMPSKTSAVRDGLEGYLYPATYATFRGASSANAILPMWRTFQQQTKGLRAHLPRSLSFRGWVTLASIVQAEARFPSDDAKIAAVFFNRLHRHMPLQSDATVYYALSGSARGPLTRTDLMVASPYNTYRHRGLPPGPIDNPGRQALFAVLHPAHVPYLYFVTGPRGHAVFATTYAQQLRHIAEMSGVKHGK